MSISRRDFIQSSATLATAGAATLALPEDSEAAEKQTLPQRVLGRIGKKMPIIGFGVAPLGSDNTHPDEATRILNYAMDQGIRYLDTAPVYGDPKSKYGNAEMKMKEILQTRRKEAFVVTKANAGRQTRDGILEQIEESLKHLGVPSVDLLHIHNLGDFDPETFYSKEGALAGALAAKERGLTQYLGVSGHLRPPRFVKALETGNFDLTMVALNFADRYHYDFEGLALPAAKKQNAAVVAMKVLGGSKDWKYDAIAKGTLASYHEHAIRYSLGLPGVSCAVIGFANEKEVQQALDVAKAYKPLNVKEKEALLAIGKELSVARGLYYGSNEA